MFELETQLGQHRQTPISKRKKKKRKKSGLLTDVPEKKQSPCKVEVRVSAVSWWYDGARRFEGGDGYHKEHGDLLQVSTGLWEPMVKV